MIKKCNYEEPIVSIVLHEEDDIVRTSVDLDWGVGVNGNQQKGWWGYDE